MRKAIFYLLKGDYRVWQEKRKMSTTIELEGASLQEMEDGFMI